jgi:hypothetical protein
MSKAEEMPIDSRGIKILAHSTIRSWTEAVVELLTNCDDAYKRVENTKRKTSGKIAIYVSRKKGGDWEKLEVSDEAGGISREDLNEVTSFFADSNKYNKNKNVRGFFGRGLKETIVALGTGEIITIKENKLNIVKIWNDPKTKKTYRHFVIENEKVTPITREEYGLKKDGTLIRINVNNHKIILPELKTLEQQLKNHISLRDILSSKEREIKLTFEDLRRGGKTTLKVYYEFPNAKNVLNKKLNVPGHKKPIELRMYEAKEKLDYKRNSALNIAGILIKTGGSILDNSLFKFENDSAGSYFYGECISEEINDMLRSEDSSILQMGRSGIDWGNEYAQLLMKTIERAIEPLIDEKKKELAKKKKTQLNKENQKLFSELSKLFNDIFKEELGDEGKIDLEIEDVFEEKVFIKPEVINIVPKTPRTICFYAHENIVKEQGESVKVCSIRQKVLVLDEKIYLERHKKYTNMFMGKIRIKGFKIGDEDVIEAILGKEKALCEVRVKEKLGKKKPGKPKPKKQGNITGFEFDPDFNPSQRAYHNSNNGKIVIFMQFPGVPNYIGEDLRDIKTEMGRMLLCEIVCEAMFKRIAKEKLDKGEEAFFGEKDADIYQNLINDLQKKHLNKVYNLVMNYDFNSKENDEE